MPYITRHGVPQTLQNYIAQNRITSLEHVMHYFIQIVDVLDALRSIGMTHNDVKDCV